MDSTLTSDVVQELALAEGVCVRPVLHRVSDLQTGDTTTVVMPCRSTRESRCPSCAAAARRVRIQQCSEGWHLDQEPEPASPDDEALDPDPDSQDDDADEDQSDEEATRRVRSTRRRSDAADLPVRPIENRTVGAVFEGNLGRRYRPSMFVTLTLPSYGAILRGQGIPENPDEYDYRTAALDAMHFPKLLDRWIQNLRRCAGYKVQYFGAIEAQRRLAPHFHVALRGAIPRRIIRAVTRATYAQVWWPPIGDPTYDEIFPEWDGLDYLDPDTRAPLKTWDEAMRNLDDDPDDADEDEQPDDSTRRVRSTRRRSDVADLPVRPVENRTVGAVFEGNLGRRYRPSMFVTLTLPSYGAILRGRGIPENPDEYDYRTAALDAMHFPKLLDRWIQNLRRCAGYKVQYFGAIEAQRRLAPHFHVALRGAIPRRIIRAVTRATYAQVWWPPIGDPMYHEIFPEWDGLDYLDPDTGAPLKTWDEAMRDLDDDPDAKPLHTLGFGRQTDIQGLLGGTPDADRAVRYLTKYLTKAISETFTQEEVFDAAYDAHTARLHDQVKVLPCSPTCANWLRYGIQPKGAHSGLRPGTCPSAAHTWEDLGLGGRRVQVSRGWSNKTLAEHRADRAAVVRKVLEEAGYTPEDADRLSAHTHSDSRTPRYQWSTVTQPPEKARGAIIESVLERRRWRAQYESAKDLLAGAGPPGVINSATEGKARTDTKEESNGAAAQHR
jgi:hypothetical protein